MGNKSHILVGEMVLWNWITSKTGFDNTGALQHTIRQTININLIMLLMAIK